MSENQEGNTEVETKALCEVKEKPVKSKNTFLFFFSVIFYYLSICHKIMVNVFRMDPCPDLQVWKNY